MLSYLVTLTVPAGTSPDNPAELLIDSVAGTLVGATIMFPPGPQGEVGVRLLHSRHQVLPALEGQWLAWDSGSITFGLNLYLEQADSQLVLQGHGAQANFSHDITVKIDIEPGPPLTVSQPVQAGLERITLEVE